MQPIGIFDSGLGGLTVASELNKRLPNQPLVYVGDTQRCPYGIQCMCDIKNYVLEIGRWLARHDAKLIIIACNTATAAGLSELKKALDIPVLGVIDAGARGAIKATRTKNVGILATNATVADGAYARAISYKDPSICVVSQAASEFVPLVERALQNTEQADTSIAELLNNEEIQSVVDRVCEPLKRAKVDTVVLGCTHFPLLKRAIAQSMGLQVTLVNPAEIVVEQVKEILGIHGMPCHIGTVENQFYTTSCETNGFKLAVQKIMQQSEVKVDQIQLGELEALL